MLPNHYQTVAKVVLLMTISQNYSNCFGLTLLQKIGLIPSDPYSNTGSDSHLQHSTDGRVEARIDNLSLLWNKSGSSKLHDVILNFLGVRFDILNPISRKIGVVWDRSYTSAGGTLYCERNIAGGDIRCRLSISGRDCGRVGNIRLRGFMLWAVANLRNLTCSRIDIAVDDFSKQLKFADIQRAVHEKQYSGFKIANCRQNFGQKHNGWTCELGRRTSEKFVRAYDKFAESKGKIDCIRWELELKAAMSDAAFRLLLAFPEDDESYQQELINLAISNIKFINRTDKNISRCPLLDWWKNWVDYIKAVPKKIRIIRAESTIATKINWIRRAVAKSLCLISDALGSADYKNFITDVMRSGRERYEDIDILLIEDYFLCDYINLDNGVLWSKPTNYRI